MVESEIISSLSAIAVVCFEQDMVVSLNKGTPI